MTDLVVIDGELFVLDPGSPPGLNPLSANAGILHVRERTMTKNERIKRLEDKIRDLEATVTEQAMRIGVLEARPLVPYVPTEPWPKPSYPLIPTYDRDSTDNHPPWYPPTITVC